MSGVDVSEEQKKSQAHQCEPCMNNVTQTFSYLQEQIAQLSLKVIKLQNELEKARKEQKDQKQVMQKEIRVLEERLAELKKQ